MKIMSSSLLSLWEVLLNRWPRIGTSPRYGTLGSSPRVAIEGTFTPPEVTTTVPTASSLTSRSRMMRLSGVICGLTLRDSTAFLNWMVVAPLEADCWYGIYTPCSMVASFWFVVRTRGGARGVRPRGRGAGRFELMGVGPGAASREGDREGRAGGTGHPVGEPR